MSNAEDPFDAVVMLEEHSCEKGYKKGFTQGQRMGYSEGTSLGRHKGSEMAKELGVYYGICKCALHLQQTSLVSHKHQDKIIGQLQAFLQDVERLVQNIDDQQVHTIIETMDDIRSQFRKLESLLKLKVNKTASSPEQLSF